jgi:phage terminase large subunit-like protein
MLAGMTDENVKLVGRTGASEAAWEAVFARYGRGEATARKLAAELGMSRSTFCRLARERGMRLMDRPAAGWLEAERPASEGPPPRLYRAPYKLKGPKTWAAVRAAYEGGGNAPAVAAHFDVTVSALRQRAIREGWVKRRDDEPPPWSPVVEAAEDGVEPADPARFQAVLHGHQRPPTRRDWSTWLLLAGRGAGKTFAGASWLCDLAEGTEGVRLALVGPTLHDVREVMIEGRSGIRGLPRYAAGSGRASPLYEPSRRRLVWENGSRAYAFSADDPESLRGPQHHGAWADELCAWKRPGETLALLRMGLRLGAAPRLVVTTTPKPLPALRRLVGEAGCATVRAASRDNARWLSPDFLERLEALYGGTRLYEQELEGRIVEADGASLWTAEGLLACRGARPAGAFEKVIVAVDPPVAQTAGGSACGIVVAGRLGGKAWVLADRSASGLSPGGWAKRVAEAAAAFGAREVVAEANQGGDMVRNVLAGAGVTCAVKLVRATEGKRARAEPVAALYEQGRVAHCAAFPQLEEELLAVGAEAGDPFGGGASGSDRADALVWAVTDLLLARPEVRLPRAWVG